MMTQILTTKSGLGYDDAWCVKSPSLSVLFATSDMRIFLCLAFYARRELSVRTFARLKPRFDRLAPFSNEGISNKQLKEYATMRTKTTTFIHPITGETIVGKEFISKKISPAARRKIAFLRHLSKNMNAYG